MKKIALMMVMVFAFSLTQAGNHVVVKTMEHNNATLQLTTAVQGTNLQAAPVFEAEMHTHHATKAKQPKADKKPKTKKTREHKNHQAKNAEHQRKHETNKAKHEHNGEHHHHKKADKK
jgi:hypothetical protein